MNELLALALLIFLAVTAQLVAARFGLSAAIFEIMLGLAVGEVLGLRSSEVEWFAFLAALGGIGLTFLAGTEMEAGRVRRQIRGSLPLALASFLSIFLTVPLALHELAGWSWDASLLAGVALSETSVAIVYVVLVEGGKARTEVGSLVLAACFLTNLMASAVLAVLFAPPDWEVLLLIAAMLLVIPLAWKYSGRLLARVKGRPGEPEVKVILLPLLLLAALASVAGVAAVLPAYSSGSRCPQRWRRTRRSVQGPHGVPGLHGLPVLPGRRLQRLHGGPAGRGLAVGLLSAGRIILEGGLRSAGGPQMPSQGIGLHLPAHGHIADLRHGLPAVRGGPRTDRPGAILNIGGNDNHRGARADHDRPEVVRPMEAQRLRLLVAVDGSVHGEKALRKAALLALSAPSYEVAVVYVVEVREFASLMAETDTEEMEAAGKRTLQESLEILASEDVQASAHLLHGPPLTKILEFAETFRPDMIVTGSRGMGAAKGALIGSVSSSLSKRASTSVLIVR